MRLFAASSIVAIALSLILLTAVLTGYTRNTTTSLFTYAAAKSGGHITINKELVVAVITLVTSNLALTAAKDNSKERVQMDHSRMPTVTVLVHNNHH
jgi:hypothetical protein